jgi:LuxR family transcriptional regulator, quorum-sensing system regulator BjaR1
MANEKDKQGSSATQDAQSLDYLVDKEALEVLAMSGEEIAAEHAQMLSEARVSRGAATTPAPERTDTLFERLDFLCDPDADAVVAMDDAAVAEEHSRLFSGRARWSLKNLFGRRSAAPSAPNRTNAARTNTRWSGGGGGGKIPFATIQAFSEACLEARESSTITSALDDLLRPRGFTSWFIGTKSHIDGMGGFGFGSFSQDWSARYVDAQHAAFDPIFHHATHAMRRETWTECRRRVEKAGTLNRAVHVLEDAEAYGLRDGLIMPIYGIGDRPGAVSFGGYDVDLSQDAQMSLFLVGAYAYEGLRRLTENFRPVPPLLSEQELRVLRWCAEGKSTFDIAGILALSPHTVREYQTRIKSKYGVSTMVQAAVSAAVDGNLKLARDSSPIADSKVATPRRDVASKSQHAAKTQGDGERMMSGSAAPHEPEFDIDPAWRPALFRELPAPRWLFPSTYTAGVT